MAQGARTLRQLFEDSPLTLVELSKRSGVNEVTLARIRDGKAARRATLNKVLNAFSEIYGEAFNTRNVSGIHLQGQGEEAA